MSHGTNGSSARFDGKVAVITGGNSGIGLATARSYVAGGGQVALFGRNQETLDAAVAEFGDSAIGVQGDVRETGDLDRLIEAVREKWGQIDLLFVNAGMAEVRPFENVDETHFDLLFDINVRGAYFTVHKATPLLQKGSSVVLTTSVANTTGFAGLSVYSATKAAVRSMARSLSAELLERGVRVNAISPGPIDTPIFGRMGVPEEAVDEMAGGFTQEVPLKRMGDANEIADGVLFLGSPESSYVVGHELGVDGGMTQLRSGVTRFAQSWGARGVPGCATSFRGVLPEASGKPRLACSIASH